MRFVNPEMWLVGAIVAVVLGALLAAGGARSRCDYPNLALLALGSQYAGIALAPNCDSPR